MQHTSEIFLSHELAVQVRGTQIRAGQIRAAQARIAQVRAAQVRPVQVGPAQISTEHHADFMQVTFMQIDARGAVVVTVSGCENADCRGDALVRIVSPSPGFGFDLWERMKDDSRHHGFKQ